MAENFTKLFASITDSTIWLEDNETRLVWITMLAMADRHGYIGASVPGLATRARVSLEATEAALAKFVAPDKHSRSKDHDGRRIEEVDRGWVLLNYERFRAIRAEEERRERDRVRQERKRERDKSRPVTACHALSREVTESHETPSASLSSESSPSESGILEAPPERAIPAAPATAVAVPPRAETSDPWSSHQWLAKFSAAWCAKYNRIAYGFSSDGKACGNLGDLLARFPPEERARAQRNAVAMISEFLADDSPAVVKASHPFAYFVTAFGGLGLSKARGSPAHRDPLAGLEDLGYLSRSTETT